MVLFFATTLHAASGDSTPELISTTNEKAANRWSSRADLKKAADANDPQACALYGDALLLGDGVPKDIAQGLVYLGKAAEGGDPDAAFRLGKIYDDGQLAPKDYPKAFVFYSAAAKAGVAEAQHNLGVMYFSAHGVPRDNVEGLAWLIVATKNGAPDDNEKLVRAGLQKNHHQSAIDAAERRASEILKNPAPIVSGTPSAIASPAAEAPQRVVIAGSGPAKIEVALPPAQLPNINKDAENRLRLSPDQSPPVSLVTPRQTIQSWPSLATLREEADQKLPQALWALGKVYLDGDLVPADPARALEFFEQAAAAGNVDAAYQLGEMYSKDTYVKHDDAKVFAYFRQAARGKVRPALYNLGACYVNGRGVARNLTEGLAWLILAKKHDVDPRMEGRIRLELQENDPQKIPLAEKRAGQLERELFPPQIKAAAPAATS